ncbi:SRPBCC family protein [Paenarthrobacter sp. NPDC056912]|uniref:SRPBCC family protein n=1 Tax=Paenarthrobacter sp. NPDC056912 TaxID=3345965 RepID=UPI00366D46A0
MRNDHMFDMLEELAKIHRTVAKDQDAETVSVTVSRAYDADPEDVWSALTDPERLPRWFYPITGDLRQGGSYQLEGNAGGEIRRCEPPAILQVTFGGPESVVDVTLIENDGKTTVELRHTVPLAMAGSGAGALFVGPGWDGAMLGLGLYLRGEVVEDPLKMANSPEVVEFNRGSIEQWTQTVELSGTATSGQIAGGVAAASAQFTPEA